MNVNTQATASDYPTVNNYIDSTWCIIPISFYRNLLLEKSNYLLYQMGSYSSYGNYGSTNILHRNNSGVLCRDINKVCIVE